jgi:hypothetical protein
MAAQGVKVRQLEAAINSGKSGPSANILVNGSAADVGSFGAAILQNSVGLEKRIAPTPKALPPELSQAKP